MEIRSKNGASCRRLLQTAFRARWNIFNHNPSKDRLQKVAQSRCTCIFEFLADIRQSWTEYDLIGDFGVWLALVADCLNNAILEWNEMI